MVLILIGLLLFQQPGFEVASVKPSTSRFLNTMLTYPGGRITCGGCWLQYLTMEAFDVQLYQVAGGPNWLKDERFDVEAKPPASSKSSTASPPYPKAPPNQEQRLMLQNLLMDRFQLKYHRDSREGPIYRLVRSNRKLNMEKTSSPDGYPWAGGLGGGMITGNGIAGTNISMSQLAFRLSRYFERPVVDETGLEGSFDFKAQYISDSPTDVASSILISIQELGLKLESSRGPVETIVIDHAEKPSGN